MPPDAPTIAKPGPIASAAPPVLKITEDPRFERVPMVRQAMLLIVPQSDGRSSVVTVRETANGGRLIVEVNGLDREVAMNVRELRELAQHLNRIARRAAIRPEWKP